MAQYSSKSTIRSIGRYVLRHVQACLSSLGQLSRAPFNTVMTCLVVGIALALPMTLLILLKNVDVFSQQLQATTQLTLYLKPETTENTARTVLDSLQKNPNIHRVKLISPAAGLQELEQQAGMNHLITELEQNPLPWTLVATPVTKLHTTNALAQLSHTLTQLPSVDSVQLDTLWIQRLFSLIALAHRAAYALALFLGMGVLLIVNNCIRTSTQNNAREIEIIKLIGGTHAFIRRPFLYAGMLYGLLGGIIAWQLVDLFLLWVRNPASQVAQLYHSEFHLMSVSLGDTVMLLAASMVLGLLGAWIAATRYLYKNKA